MSGDVAGLGVRVRPGDGPPVAWVHGYTLDSSVWKAAWELLPGWTHVGIDLPGHGRSRPLAPDERLVDLGRQIAETCAAHGARHLVGLSFGSTVALQAAIAAGVGLLSLVLGAPAVAGGPTDAAAEIRYTQLAELYHAFGPGPHMTKLWMSSPPDIFRHVGDHPVLWAQMTELIGRHSWRELGDGAMRSLARHVHRPADLARIEARTLVLLGEHDMPAFRQSAAILAGCVPRCRAVEVPDTGHLCLVERPDRVATVISEHLRAAQTITPPTS